MSVTHPLRGPTYAWPDGEAFADHPLGTLKSGKEAEIFLVERRFARSGPRLLAYKRYRPRYPTKGQLREEGFSNATRYRGDAVYKAGWNINARDRRALNSGNKSQYGHELAAAVWPMQEWSNLRRAWEAGVAVPYPVEQREDGLLMEFIGDESEAAQKLAQARLGPDELVSAWQQVTTSLVALTMAGMVHADMSVYNLLWWRGRVIVIDLPQAVEFTTNSDAFELLHRDVANVGEWFGRRGVPLDVEAVYAELVSVAWFG